MLTKTDLKILKPYESHFKTAKLGYIRGIYHSDIQILLPLYNKLGYKLNNPNCADCILVMFKKLGEAYDKKNK